MHDESLDAKQMRSALEAAQRLERDADAYPDERAEIFLEAAGQYALGGDPQRALEIYDGIITSGPEEDAQWATVGKLDVLGKLGRMRDAENEIARLDRSRILPGPASMVAEFLEHHGRLEEALDWFNTACRDLLADEAPEVGSGSLISRIELQGRLRVRKALGLPPDTLDERVEEEHADMVDTLDRFAASRQERPPARIAGFFVRDDVKRAFAEGLVLVDDLADEDIAAYFRRCERSWRATSREGGAPTQQLLPTTVDDLLAYAAEHDLDPADQETRAEHLQQRIREGAATLVWPPERNAGCWCGSGRKYKKCCGAPGNR